MLYGIIIAIITLIAFLLTVVVLLQSGQGQGLSGGLAAQGGPAGQMMGARRTADILSKTTSILGASFLVLCVLANFFIDRGEVRRSAVQGSGYSAPVTLPPNNLGGQENALPNTNVPAQSTGETESEQE